MTTVAWDGKTLAADTLVTGNGTRLGRTVKAHRVGRLLVGLSGTVGLAQGLLHWLAAGAEGDPPPMGSGNCQGEVIVVLPDGRIVTFDQSGRDFIRAEFYAVGSGAKFAMAAMAAGADSRRAVEVAAMLDCYTGGEITVLKP